MKLSIVVPVYNEETTIGEVIKKIQEVKLPKAIKKEIIVIDDGSTDKSPQIIEAIKKEDRKIISYISIINLGKGAAVRFGFKFSSGDIILIQDADLELDPNDYPKLISPILDGETEVVYGSRFMSRNPNIPLDSRIANQSLSLMASILYGQRLTDMETAYKVMTRKVLDKIRNRLRSVEFTIEPEITARIIQAGYKIKEVPIGFNPRSKAAGKKASFKDAVEAMIALVKCRLY